MRGNGIRRHMRLRPDAEQKDGATGAAPVIQLTPYLCAPSSPSRQMGYIVTCPTRMDFLLMGFIAFDHDGVSTQTAAPPRPPSFFRLPGFPIELEPY